MIHSSILSPVLGEFAGTFVMIVLGDGVVAACILKRTKAEGAGWIGITTGWAFAVMAAIFVSTLFGSPAAYLNPALTIAFAVKGGEAYANVLPFILAEFAGAFAAAVFVWLFYLPHWKETEDQPTKLAVFCTGPAIRSYGSNLFSEGFATFILMLILGAVGSKHVLTSGAAAGLSPFLVGCVVWSIGLSLGATSGYAINPARDLGPRLAHAVLPIYGKGGSDWGYAWIPVLGPIIGATLAALLLRFMGA